MSRSYKKFPGYSDGEYGNKAYGKREAARRVRHADDVPDGGAYKKLFEAWDISDYNFRYFSLREVEDMIDRYYFDGCYTRANDKFRAQMIARMYAK